MSDKDLYRVRIQKEGTKKYAEFIFRRKEVETIDLKQIFNMALQEIDKSLLQE